MKTFEYFQLKRDEKVSNPIQIFHFAVEGDIIPGKPIEPEAVPEHQVSYFEYSPQLEICHVLFQPLLLVEDKVKRLWDLYESQIKYKGVRVFANDSNINISPMYWCPVVEKIDCLDDKSEFYPNGTMKKLVVRFQTVEEHHVFQVQGVLEPITIVSLPVAESMLKRSMFGFQLEPVILV